MTEMNSDFTTRESARDRLLRRRMMTHHRIHVSDPALD
jgi:hypothetical protein